MFWKNQEMHEVLNLFDYFDAVPRQDFQKVWLFGKV